MGTTALGNYKDYSGWWPNAGWSIRCDEWAITRAIDKGETTASAPPRLSDASPLTHSFAISCVRPLPVIANDRYSVL